MYYKLLWRTYYKQCAHYTLASYDILHCMCLQCFDTFGWAAGRVSDPDEVLVWLSVWSKV